VSYKKRRLAYPAHEDSSLLSFVAPFGIERSIEEGAITDEPGTGMRCGVDFGELGDRHAGVDLGGLQALMAEQRLDEPDIGTALQHQRRGRVAEQMA
jgi:hypothetical protein